MAMETDQLALLMLKFIEQELTQVPKMKKPMTLKQAERLCHLYSRSELKETLLEMDNFAPLLKKYISAGQTLEQWILLKRKKAQWSGKKTLPMGNEGLFTYEQAIEYCHKTHGNYEIKAHFDLVKKEDKNYWRLK